MLDPHGYTTFKTALKTYNENGVTKNLPCKGIMVSVADAKTFTNPDGTTAALPLAVGFVHDISTDIALTGGTGTIWYVY